MRWWKWLGVAGMAGVAATGVVVARSERQRRAYSPDDVRARLHERAATAENLAGQPESAPASKAALQQQDGTGPDPTQPSQQKRWARLRRR